MTGNSKIHPVMDASLPKNNKLTNNYHTWERDSDCSSSIHSRPGHEAPTADERLVFSAKSGRSEQKVNDVEEVLSISRKSGKDQSQIREKIIQDVMNEILPDLGGYADGSLVQRGVASDNFFVVWFKFLGCLAMDLHDAVLSGSLDEVKRSVRKICTGPNAKPELMNAYDARGRTAFSVAVASNLFEISLELFDNSASIECPDEETGRTPLFHAIQNRNFEMTKFLLTQGAKANTTDLQCVTPLMLACSNDDDKLARLLTDANADVDLQDERGWTALHYAITRKAEKCVKLLLEEGADRNLRDMNRRKPIHFAKFHDFGNCVALLSDKGKMTF
jgi:hypothetical protein